MPTKLKPQAIIPALDTLDRSSPPPPWLLQLEAALVRMFLAGLILHPDVSLARANRCLVLALKRLEPDRQQELLELALSVEIANFIDDNGVENVADFIEAALDVTDLSGEVGNA